MRQIGFAPAARAMIRYGQTGLSLIAVFGLFALNSCGSAAGNGVTGCVGTHLTKKISSNTPPITGSDPESPFTVFSSTVINGRRHYTYQVDVNDICSSNHVTATYRVDVHNLTANGLAIGDIVGTTKVHWAVFYDQEGTLTASDIGSGTFSLTGGIGDVGLKQAFGDASRATVTLEIDLSFPSRGSDEITGNAILSLVELDLTYDTFVGVP